MGAAASSIPRTTTPTVAERYTLLAEAGRGGMGVVHRGYDKQLRRTVAVKQLSAAARLTEGAHRRLRNEASTMARISHPNVVPIFDTVTEGGETSIVMEFVDGPTLHQWLLDDELSIAEILATFVEIADGLDAIHRADVVHCDFKPGNVLLSPDGTPKVTDFGLARFARAAEPSLRSIRRGTPPAAPPKFVFGTAVYMAPEQHAGQDLTPAADQYAFCVALWEALSGTRLFVSRDSSRLATLKNAAAIPPLPAGVPSRIERVIRRGLSAEPMQRWSSMAALGDALRPRHWRQVVANAIGLSSPTA